MSDAYEKLATRARELLSVRPRPATEDVASLILAEIAAEFEVPERLRGRFTARLVPALVQIVSGVRSKLVRELEEEAARAYLAKPVPSAEVPASPSAEPSSLSPASALGSGDGPIRLEAQRNLAVPAPTPASGGQRLREVPTPAAALPESGPGRADGGHGLDEAHSPIAAPPAPEGAANYEPEPIEDAPPSPVTPLSLRIDVLDGWRTLRDETMFVPEHGDVTYGSATAQQIDRAITYQHSRAHAAHAKARRLRVLRDTLTEAGANCLDDLLDGRALAGRES